MNWNDLEGVWRHQDVPREASGDINALVASFEARHRRQAATLLVRDVSESAAGLLVAAFFAYLGWQMQRAGAMGWPMGIAALLMVGVSAVFLRERVRARQRRLDPGAPTLVKVEYDLAELQRQRQLLRNVGWWYLAPVAGALTIMLATVVINSPAGSPLRVPGVIVGFSLFFAVVLIAVWLINRRAVTRQIEPRIGELANLRAQLLNLAA